MKKIALILALVMVLSCGLLASCGNNENTSSAADTSSTVSVADESTADESADASVAESTDESVEESAEESTAPAEITGSNIAVGCTTTISQQFQQGGADKSWGWDDNAPIAYPDAGNEATDGVIAAADAAYSDDAFFAFSPNAPDYATDGCSFVTIDLGASKDITGAIVYVGTSLLNNGINVPNGEIGLYVSDDGENWTLVTTATAVDDASVAVTTVELAGAASGQYVQIRVASSGWMFLTEIEVYAE